MLLLNVADDDERVEGPAFVVVCANIPHTDTFPSLSPTHTVSQEKYMHILSKCITCTFFNDIGVAGMVENGYSMHVCKRFKVLLSKYSPTQACNQ